MQTLDLAVIGSGIGGSLISALNIDKNSILFEKDKNLGGCASTFKRYGNYYNTGATTLVGYEDNHILKKQFDEIGINPNITKSDIAIRVIQNNKILDRVKNFEEFINNINELYPNKNNEIFWKKIKQIDERFWQLKKIYYAKYALNKYIKTISFLTELFTTFKFDMLQSADSFIKEILGNISKEYQNFIDSQLLITIQCKSKGISLLSLSLGLSYPFHDVFYVNNGMGNLIKEIIQDVEVRKNEEINKIIKDGQNWIVQSNKDEYKTKQIVLNSSIYETSHLFDDINIKKYYDSFSFNDQSAFVVYLTLDTNSEFLEHYQFIYDDILPNCISNSFFVSVSKKGDKILSKNHTLSVTISTHTKATLWKDVTKEQYEYQKNITQTSIIKRFLEYFTTITQENILKYFSATSFTFNRYISRYNCGGKAIGFNNLHQLPSCNTPFSGLYNVGDTIFAGQGWPGIAVGVDVLQKELNGIS